jgi:oligopeptide/dipeptide ABC transporter ATP-binding protein
MTTLALRDVCRTFVSGLPWARQRVRALGGVSFSLAPGETVGVLGESGSGKTTLLRLDAFLLRPTAGTVVAGGADPWQLSPEARRQLRRHVQVVFQEGSDALDPRQTVASAVAEPLANFGVRGGARRERVAAALDAVGVTPELLGRYPGELSGGQRQRVSLARALTVDPDLLLLDEPVSALDVSVGAQVLNLLADLQASRGLGMLLISHELPVVRYLAHRVLVLFAGVVVEEGPAAAVLDAPAHPYTRLLRTAALTVDPEAGLPEVPPPAPASAAGCAFATRCPAVMPRCRAERPPAYAVETGRQVRCFLYDQAPQATSAAAASH